MNGSMPSIVVPSSLHPVYFAQSRSTSSELKPAAFRFAMNIAASFTLRLPIIAWGESPTIKNGRPRWSTRYRRFPEIFRGKTNDCASASARLRNAAGN